MLSSETPFVVALDACVLYGFPLRDTLLRAVEEELYRPVWSYQIWDEVLRHLMDPTERTKNLKPLTDEAAQHLLTTIETNFPAAFISGYEDLIPVMRVQEKDRHVAAVAVRAHAQVIVTSNIKHFPDAALASYDIEAQHPDEFLTNLYSLNPETMARIIREQAAALRKRTMTPEEILDKLEQSQQTTEFARLVRSYFRSHPL